MKNEQFRIKFYNSFFHLYNKEAFMIHSVKDFVDKKMNNKLICFNNVLDDYLFFYDIKKDSFCATKRNKKHIEDDHVFLDDYKSKKKKYILRIEI